MGQIVANIAEYPSAEDCYCSVPIVEENGVGEFVESCCEGDEKGRWHDEAVSVHGEVVVDAVEEEVGCDADPVIWKVSIVISARLRPPLTCGRHTYPHGTTLYAIHTPQASKGKVQLTNTLLFER